MATLSMDGQGGALLARIKKAFETSERHNAVRVWELLAEFIHNNQANGFQAEKSKGSKLTDRVYDSTAIQANNDLASTMHSTVISPLQRWALPIYSNAILANNKAALTWLEEAIKLIYAELNESNLDQEIGKAFQSLSALGTCAIYHEAIRGSVPGDFRGFNFEALHLSEIAIEENDQGQVDSLYRKRRFTVKQILQRWGKRAPREVTEMAETKPNHEFEFYWCIKPNDPRKIKLDNDGLAEPMARPYVYYWVMEKGAHIMEEGGYYEFPVYVPRWSKLPCEVYGRGPGHIALPTIRTLNKVIDLHLRGMAKVIDPPILASQRETISNLSLLPGHLTIVGDPQGFRQFVPESRFDVTQLNIAELRNEIKQLFFLDKLFLPPRTETGEMTATEVVQRLEQAQKALGPTMNRLNHELLSPLFIRAFRIMMRAGALPPPPDIVVEQGVDVEIRVVNQLARAQQFEDVSNILQWVEQVATMAQLTQNEGVLDLVNIDAIARYIKSIRGVPEIALRSIEEIEQIRQQRAQQQQQLQTLAAAQQVSEVAKNIGGSGLE